MTILSKVCDTCHEEKPLDKFKRSNMTSDGRCHFCLVCMERIKIRHLMRDRAYTREGLQFVADMANVIGADKIAPDGTIHEFPGLWHWYENTELIPQRIVIPLTFVFDQLRDMGAKHER